MRGTSIHYVRGIFIAGADLVDCGQQSSDSWGDITPVSLNPLGRNYDADTFSSRSGTVQENTDETIGHNLEQSHIRSTNLLKRIKRFLCPEFMSTYRKGLKDADYLLAYPSILR